MKWIIKWSINCGTNNTLKLLLINLASNCPWAFVCVDVVFMKTCATCCIGAKAAKLFEQQSLQTCRCPLAIPYLPHLYIVPLTCSLQWLLSCMWINSSSCTQILYDGKLYWLEFNVALLIIVFCYWSQADTEKWVIHGAGETAFRVSAYLPLPSYLWARPTPRAEE